MEIRLRLWAPTKALRFCNNSQHIVKKALILCRSPHGFISKEDSPYGVVVRLARASCWRELR